MIPENNSAYNADVKQDEGFLLYLYSWKIFSCLWLCSGTG
jgi:hypothetical protein